MVVEELLFPSLEKLGVLVLMASWKWYVDYILVYEASRC